MCVLKFQTIFLKDKYKMAAFCNVISCIDRSIEQSINRALGLPVTRMLFQKQNRHCQFRFAEMA